MGRASSPISIRKLEAIQQAVLTYSNIDQNQGPSNSRLSSRDARCPLCACTLNLKTKRALPFWKVNLQKRHCHHMIIHIDELCNFFSPRDGSLPITCVVQIRLDAQYHRTGSLRKNKLANCKSSE